MDLSAESLQYQYLSPVVVSEVLHTLGVGWTERIHVVVPMLNDVCFHKLRAYHWTNRGWYSRVKSWKQTNSWKTTVSEWRIWGHDYCRPSLCIWFMLCRVFPSLGYLALKWRVSPLMIIPLYVSFIVFSPSYKPVWTSSAGFFEPDTSQILMCGLL